MSKAISSSSSALTTKSQSQKKIGSKPKYPDHILFHPVFTHSTPQRQGVFIDADRQTMSGQPSSQGQMNYPATTTAGLSVTIDGFIKNSFKSQFAAKNISNNYSNENANLNDGSIAAVETNSAKHKIAAQLNGIISPQSLSNEITAQYSQGLVEVYGDQGQQSAQNKQNQLSNPLSSQDNNQVPYVNNFNKSNNITNGQNTASINSTTIATSQQIKQLQQNLFPASSSSSNNNKFAMFTKPIAFPKKKDAINSNNKKKNKINSSANIINQVSSQFENDSQIPAQHYLITEPFPQQAQHLSNQGSSTIKQQQSDKMKQQVAQHTQDSIKYFLGIQHNTSNHPFPPTGIPLQKTLGAAYPGVFPMTNTTTTSSNSSQRHHPASSANLKTHMDSRELEIQQNRKQLSQPYDNAVFTEGVVGIQQGQEVTPLPSKQHSTNNTKGSSNSKHSGSSKNNNRNTIFNQEDDYFSKAKIEEIHQQNQWKKRITAVDKAILEGDSDPEEDNIQDTLQTAYYSKKSQKQLQQAPAIVSSRDCQINLSYNQTELHFEFATTNRTSDWLMNYLIRRIYAYHIRVLKDNIETTKRILRTIIGFASTTSNIAVSYFFTQKNRSLAVFHHKCLHIQPLFDAETDLSKPLRYSDVSLSDFNVIRCIGLGGFSRVYLVQKKDTAKMYALKLIDKQFIIDNKKEVIVSNERNIMMSIAHPFLLKLEFAFESKSYIGFTMEYCAGGELFYHLRRIKRMQEQMARFYFVEICLGIDYLHKRNIIYRDIKPENIFLDIDGHVRIGDFGLAKPDMDVNNRAYSFCGSPEYMAPEMLLKIGHTYTVDFYCLGALLYELVTGLPPFYSQDTDEIYKRILSEELTFPGNITLTLECRDLLDGLLAKHPKSRLGSQNGIRDILAHPWFKPINIGDILEKRIEPLLKPSELGFNFDEEEFNAGEENFRKRLVDSQIGQDESNLPMIFDDFYFDANLARLRKQLISKQQQQQQQRIQQKETLNQIPLQKELLEQQQEQDIRLSKRETQNNENINSNNAEQQQQVHQQQKEQLLFQGSSAEEKQQLTQQAASVLHHGTYKPNQQQQAAIVSQSIAANNNTSLGSLSLPFGGQLFNRTSPPSSNGQTAANMNISRQTTGSLGKKSNSIDPNPRWNTESSASPLSSNKFLMAPSSSSSKSSAYLDQQDQTLYKPKSSTTAKHLYQPQALPFKHFKDKTATQGILKSDNKSAITTNKSLIGFMMMMTPSNDKQQQQSSSFLHRQPSAKTSSNSGTINNYGNGSNTNASSTSTNRSTSKNKQNSNVNSSNFNNFLASKISNINGFSSSSNGYLNYGKTPLAGNQQAQEEQLQEKQTQHGEQILGNTSNPIMALGNSSALKRLKTENPTMISSTIQAECITNANKSYGNIGLTNNNNNDIKNIEIPQQQQLNMQDKPRDIPQITGIVSDINRRSRVLMKANSQTNINKPPSQSASSTSLNHHHQSHSQQHHSHLITSYTSTKQFSSKNNSHSNTTNTSSSSTKHTNHSLSNLLNMQPLLSHSRNNLVAAGSLSAAQHSLNMQSQSTIQKHYNPIDFIAQRTAKY